MERSTEVWVITGASRGIGAAMVAQVLQKEGVVVFACARQPSSSAALKDCKHQYGARLHLITLDVTNESSVQAAAEEIMALEATVDVLINNAGISEALTIQTRKLSPRELMEVMGANASGAHCTTQAFIPLLEGSSIKTIVNISSLSGSTTTWSAMVHDKESPLLGFSKVQAAYRASKAALNSVTVSWALDLTPDSGFKFVALHPGLVRTDMASKAFKEMGRNMDDLRSFVEVLTPDDSAKNIIKIVGGLKGEDSGRFIDYNGNSLPF